MARGSAAAAAPPVIDIKPEALGGELETQTRAVVAKLAGIVIADQAACQQAVLDRQDIGARIKAVEAFFEPFKSAAYKLWKSLCARENDIVKPLQALDGQLRSGIQRFTDEQERLRRAEEQRIADERQQEEQARQLAAAAALEQQGETALAQVIVEEAIAAPAPVVVLPSVTQQVQGLKLREEWKWRYSGDQARAMALIPREYLCVDEKKVGAYVRAMKGTARIPGIEVYCDKVPVR